jgi:hypothetical protein
MNEEMDPELPNEAIYRMEREDDVDPAEIDDEIHRMEQEEPPHPHPSLKYQEIKPPFFLDEDRYKKLYKCYLLPEHGPHDIQPNTLYFTRDSERRIHYKFLLLKNKLRSSYKSALNALENADWGAATRGSATGQPNPKKITYGWYPQTPGHIAGHGFDSVRSEPTLSQPGLAHGLRPMVRAMDRLLAEYLPTYYPTALRLAMDALRREDENEEKYLDRVRNNPKSPFPEKDVAVLKGMDMMGWVPDMAAYMLWGTVFSTLELNKHIVFRAHEDEYNAESTLVCIAALGTWVGGRIILPRYGFGADLEPYDLLIVDNRDEFHGNLGPLVGPQESPRFSVVAFLHSNVLEYANREGLWKTKAETPIPFTYTPNFLTKEEANELAAYFDTLPSMPAETALPGTFSVRKTKWGKEIKRQSLGYIARNAFNDRRNWGTEYADIDTAPEIIQRFRRKLAAHAGQEINYISILKYPNSEAVINWHNHAEDRWHNSPVWDVTVGPTERRFWAREVANPKTTVTSVLAEVGSLVTLPSSMNTTHEHAILKDKTMGVRYSINCKSLPLYGVWDCHAGKNYPKDAVYVGRRVMDRKGNVIREGTIFGNGMTDKDAFKTEAEFREYAEKQLENPAFRAEVEKLRGKHLLCWCVQTGPDRDEFCHARVWLEIANRKALD